MILGFKQQFIEPILSGQKIHTIREDKHNRWIRGEKIHFTTKVRTKNQKTFMVDLCQNTQEIEIRFDNKDSDYPAVIIDGAIHRVYHKPCVILQVAMNDGFENIGRFFEWFDFNFKGKIIHWTDLKY